MTKKVTKTGEKSTAIGDSALWVLTKISWLNVWRSKKRSLIIITAVIIGLWSRIFLLPFYNGMVQQRVSSVIANELLSFTIASSGIQEGIRSNMASRREPVRCNKSSPSPK